MAHPKADLNGRFVAWTMRRLAEGREFVIPEIADYEVRRGFLHRRWEHSVERLNRLQARFRYVPLSTVAMVRAAEFWAASRRKGLPTADPKELDGDVILAAQAESVGGIVITENVGHLARFVPAKSWADTR